MWGPTILDVAWMVTLLQLIAHSLWRNVAWFVMKRQLNFGVNDRLFNCNFFLYNKTIVDFCFGEHEVLLNSNQLGDNCIQNVHLGKYIVGYMVGNFVLQRHSRAVIRNFRPYNWCYTSPNEHFEYGYHHSSALFNIYLSKAQHFAPN